MITASIQSFLDAQSAALAECRATAGANPLPLLDVFQPVRVLQTWPTHPQSDREGWAAETSDLPLVARRSGKRGTGPRLYERDWAWIRSDVTDRPVLLLGEAGSGKSTLLAWECLARTRALVDGAPASATAPAKLPILLGASDLATDGPIGAGGASVVVRIADAAARRVTGAACHATVRREIRDALEHGAASLLLDDVPIASDATDAASVAADLRELCWTCPGVELVVTARFAAETAPDLRPLVWRVFEIAAWQGRAAERFVERVLDARRAPAPARRRARSLADVPTVARAMETPRVLALLCDAVTVEPTTPTATLARRAVGLVLAAEGGADGSPAEVERELELLERFALGRRCGRLALWAEGQTGDDEAHASSPAAATAAIRAGIVRRADGAADAPWELQRGLTSTLAATALARRPDCAEMILAGWRRSRHWHDVAILAAGVLAVSDRAQAERLMNALLAEPFSCDAPGTSAFAARCAAEMHDLPQRQLELLVGQILDACEELIVRRPPDDRGAFEPVDSECLLSVLRCEYALDPLATMIGATFRAYGNRPELGPLRRRLAALLATGEATTRRRAVDVIAEAASCDGSLRRTLVDLLHPTREPDAEVRRAAVQALTWAARHDALLREWLLQALDAQREPDVDVRRAAAVIAGGAAAFDDRVAAFAASRIDPLVEPSAAVRRSLMLALQSELHARDVLRRALERCLEREPDPEVAAMAAHACALGREPDARVAALLRARLESGGESDGRARGAAAGALRHAAVGDERTRHALLRHLDPSRERDAGVRAGAASGLRFVAAEDADVRAALIAASDAALEPDDEVRESAVSALGAAVDEHEEVRLALCARVNVRREPNARVRLVAVSELRDAVVRDATLRSVLLPSLAPSVEPDRNVRGAVAAALGRCARHDTDSRRALVERLDVPDDVRQPAVLALTAVVADDADVRAKLLELLADDAGCDAPVRACAAHALGHAVEHHDVRAALLRHAGPRHERDPLVRRFVARALAALAGSADDVRTALLNMLVEQREPDPEVRGTAAAALREPADVDPLIARELDARAADADPAWDDPFEAFFLTFSCSACRG